MLGFATQAAFLIGAGMESLLSTEMQLAAEDLQRQAQLAGEARRLMLPGEMGEVFKVIALGRGFDAPLVRLQHPGAGVVRRAAKSSARSSMISAASSNNLSRAAVPLGLSATVMNLRKIRPWAFYFLAWTLVGLIYFAQNVTRRFYWEDPNPWQDLRYWSANIYISALLTPLIIWAGRRWPLERQRLGRAARAALPSEHRLGAQPPVARGHVPSHLERVLAHPAAGHVQERDHAAVHLWLSHRHRGLLGGALHPDGVAQLRALPGARARGVALGVCVPHNSRPRWRRRA